MSAVEVTISGVLYDKINRTTQNVVLIGEATLTGLGVGGGPILPPLPPGWGGGKPPGIWGGGNEGFPTPPIVTPKPPIEPPPDGGDKPPPEAGGWGYVADWNQWGYFPGPNEARPK